MQECFLHNSFHGDSYLSICLLDPLDDRDKWQRWSQISERIWSNVHTYMYMQTNVIYFILTPYLAFFCSKW